MLRTPSWEDFVSLTFSEIRLYGAGNFQVARRLRAMLDDLVEILPIARQPALQRELELLNRAVERLYELPDEVAFARQPDLQGLGGTGRLIPT